MAELKLFDILEFNKMTFKEYKKIYSGQIRISKVFDKLKKIKTGIKLYNYEVDKLFLCKYKKGDWRDGEPKLYIPKKNNKISIIRIPIVNIENTNIYIALDGNHRLQLENPSFVIMDYIIINSSNYMYITELYNPYYRKYLKLNNNGGD